MNNAILLVRKRTVIEYHLFGLALILSYLMIALQKENFWGVFSIIGLSVLVYITFDLIIKFKRPVWDDSVSSIKNQIKQIVFDISPYLFTASVVAITEILLINHSALLVSKIVFVIISIGFYIAVSLSLEAEYGYIKEHKGIESKNITQIIPAALKWRYFQFTLLIIDLLILTIAWVEHSIAPHAHDFFELLFSSLVVISFSLYLLHLYNRNLIHIVGIQVNILSRVEDGRFDVAIPTVSDNELALLASYHNTMIDRLRDRERLYRTLEKSVGSNIMRKLLSTDEETLKQGQAYNVAILFCDLRGFTSLGESASAEEIILFLNVYFTDISQVISENNGIINKFMGDAVLAIFGLEGGEGNPVQDAVNASLDIIQHSTDLYMPNAMHPESGVGIDFGTVVGATIGSEERYEYTIIGDAVNKASRLESLSKRLGYSIILSQNAYTHLPDEIRQHFEGLGSHRVRGGGEAVTVYGCGKKITD